MTAPAPTTRAFEPETLMGKTRLGDSEYRVIVRLLSWLGSVKQTDLAHPWVRRWGVPACCVVLGIPSLLNAGSGSGPGLPAMLALTAGFTVPLLWRGRRPVLVFAVTIAVSVVGLALGAVTGASGGRLVALLNVARFGTPAQLVAAAVVTIAQTIVAVVVFSASGMMETLSRTPARCSCRWSP